MIKTTSWMCTRCGKRHSTQLPRPMPGKCSKSKTGAPHRWVKIK